MDYNQMNYNVFTKGLNPSEITRQPKAEEKLKGFVYVISKFFQPYEDMKSGNKKKDQKLNNGLNLVKIGRSTMTTKQAGGDKSHGRVGNLRTALISLKVHRFYIFPRYDMPGKTKEANSDSMNAAAAEDALHYAVMKKFKPAVMRLEFRTPPTATDKERFTEWFHIPEKRMDEFLKFLDDQVFNQIDADVTYGTGFTKDTMFNVRETITLVPKIRNIEVVKNRRSLNKRQHAMKLRVLPEGQKYSRSNEQFTRKLEEEKEKERRKEMHKKRRKRYEGKVDFWKSQFMPNGVGLKFRDIHAFHPKLKDKYPKKKIVDVRKHHTKIWVHYEPDVTARQLANMDPELKEMEQGRLTINEMIIEHFPEMRTKSKFIEESYQWHVYENKYNPAANDD